MSQLDADAFETMSPADRGRVLDGLRRGASRRDILGLLGSAGMGLLAGGAVFGSATKALAQTPKRGGNIRVCTYTSSTSDTLDPAKQSNASDYVRCNFFYNKLVRIDQTGAPGPELAESYDSPDAKTWTFTLRKGVTFHDGKALTVEDVIFSLKRHLDPAVGSKANTLAKQMTAIEAAGPNEVRIVLSGANADWPVILGTAHFHIVQAGTTDFSKGIGTGPFKCKEFTPGVRTIAVRNDNYWRQPGPFLDSIEFFGLPDEQSRVNALMSGDVQIAAVINPRSLRVIESMGGFNVLETKAGLYTDLIARLDEGPGTNPDFVLGMKYLLNRAQMRSAVFRGYAEIANDHPIPSSNRYYAADIPQRPYDPEKAKFHFNKAGVLGSTIPLVASPAADASVEMAVLIQQDAKKLGLNIDVQRVPSDGYWSNYWMKSPLCFGNINPRPTADLLFSLFFKSDAAWNESRWKNPAFDQLIVGARAERDEAKRKQMYHDAQVLVHEGAGIGIPAFISNIDCYSSKIKGLHPIPTGGLMGYTFGEYAWLDA
ncbi:ABC transporter substrate-binding protein [Methylobacterium indicum]|uniref:ABC transporter substrate-binding protein n=2 Tax=Methylobacterium indicum TaxID=1775910 RepID=A0ABR5HI81_9HYPH|nr:ABC transporter substrate-binding protein [Methylobacterium indicum]KMO26365.1 ABC transporter substrate-binding protein [Methylobacterium indicum]KTS24912.1 ABC transporter substrate-binding protein [Methylobacterium indicum]KTS34161.1 ABC transporter substrate-binding protein [Methylobacterium indicum]KTS45702.1 ABC transporter substrate-binding protein [Methylobacterium indicum]